jgi:hypothetical protein
MKNILILADGSIAKHFIEWISRKRVVDNKYYVVTYTQNTIPENMAQNITHIEADPTSFSKLRMIMEDVKYSNIFIVMENINDAEYSLKNIRLVDSKIRVILTNQWDDNKIGRDEGEENVTILNNDEIISAHLYDHLPNVPVVAQNVGLGKGEIMEILVPFGSTYAFRHVGSILQRKWKIAAIYRDEKQIIPNNATMIRPNDTLLVLGKPIVLDGVYKTINKRIGLFPEPFGKDLYLIIDFRYDQKNVLLYVKECIYLLDKLEHKSLFIRILYPNNFDLINELKSYESENITVSICYDDENINTLLEYDIQEYDIGLVLNSMQTFEGANLRELLYSLKKVVYIFGNQLLYNIKECIILMDDKEKMESISSTAFDITESLNIELTLADFDPEGDFDSKKMIIEHYETISHIFNMDINIEQKIANPIREISLMQDILQIAPFEKEFGKSNILRFVSTKVKDFLLTSQRHPKLLVPFALAEA